MSEIPNLSWGIFLEGEQTLGLIFITPGRKGALERKICEQQMKLGLRFQPRICTTVNLERIFVSFVIPRFLL